MSPADLTHTAAARLSLVHLVRLRWGALTFLAVLVLALTRGMGLHLQEGPALAAVVLALASNAALWRWLRSAAAVGPGAAAGVMLADTALLTFVLALSGGPSNPFSTLYLVNVALAAALLPGRWPYALLGASLGGFGLLFLPPLLPGAEELQGPSHAELMRLHLQGMWLAFALAGVAIVLFVRRVRRELATREAALARAEDLRRRQDKVASLATLAAGAAHELSTPLSTIAVAAADAQAALDEGAAPGALRADLQLVRAQVARCRDILQQMAAGAGAPVGEGLEEVALADCAEAALAGLADAPRVRCERGGAVHVRAPRRALAGALRALVHNALQAGPAGAPVVVRWGEARGHAFLEVEDAGPGMPADVLARAGEPFFTTRAPGEGTGLGLFLARTLVEALGGALALDSAPGRGTRARLSLPRAGEGAR